MSPLWQRGVRGDFEANASANPPLSPFFKGGFLALSPSKFFKELYRENGS